MQYIKIHALDSIAVALANLAEGIEVSVNNQTVTLRQDVARGYKFALMDIAKGVNVIGHDLSIGYALVDIITGGHAHAHNTCTSLNDLDQYHYQPGFQNLPAQAADREMQIYRRANGNVGACNELWILPTVDCVSDVARQIQNHFLKETNNAEDTDGMFLFSHIYGCSQLGDDHINTRTMLQSMVRHPNTGVMSVVGLGCENNQVTVFRKTLSDIDPEHVHFIICQQQDDEIEIRIAHLYQLYNVMRSNKREPDRPSELKLDLECGDSDGSSGITANLMLGRFSDCVVTNGGTTVLTEVPEMFGAGQLLMDRRRDEATFEKSVTMANDFKQHFTARDQLICENPSPKNEADSITTLEDKSFNYTQKAGTSVVVDVLRHGERPKTPGLNLLSALGNGVVATSALAGAGRHMVLLNIDHNTPYGGFVLVMKIVTNNELMARRKHWINFDAGQLIHGKATPQLLGELIDTIAEFANGKQTCNERNDSREPATFKNGIAL